MLMAPACRRRSSNTGSSLDGHKYYLDLAWPDRMVAVECNDAGSHDTPKAFRRDPMKRNRCEGAGWLYLEFTWWDMVQSSTRGPRLRWRPEPACARHSARAP